MKIKTYSLFESNRLNVKEYLDYLIDDFGFKLKINGNIYELFLEESEYDSVDILNVYNGVINYIKSDYIISDHWIVFGVGKVKIRIKIEITDDDLTKEQLTALNALKKCTNKKLIVSSVDKYYAIVDSVDREYRTSWVTIYKDGRVKTPILSVRNNRTTEIPFTDEDIKWFKRMLHINKIYHVFLASKELKFMDTKSEEELRNFYKKTSKTLPEGPLF